jgi:hypothetical protein
MLGEHCGTPTVHCDIPSLFGIFPSIRIQEELERTIGCPPMLESTIRPPHDGKAYQASNKSIAKTCGKSGLQLVKHSLRRFIRHTKCQSGRPGRKQIGTYPIGAFSGNHRPSREIRSILLESERACVAIALDSSCYHKGNSYGIRRKRVPDAIKYIDLTKEGLWGRTVVVIQIRAVS